MPVTQTKVQYKTSNGRKFDTQEEADRHEALITARDEYDQARRRFNAAIIKTQKTADGEPFDTGLFRDYHYVSEPFWSSPTLVTVNYIGWNFEVGERDEGVVIISRPDDQERSREYPIHKLYRHKHKAMAVLFEAQRKWLKERGEQMAADEAAWREHNQR